MTIDDRSFRTSRILPFPPDAVYGAFAAPEQLAEWWGPEGFSNRFEHFDFKVGGRWVFVMVGPDGKEYANQNVFLELQPHRRVVLRHDCAPWFTLTITLDEAESGATRVSWEQVLDDVKTARAVAHVVIPANEQNLDRLHRVLAKGQA